MFPAPPPITRRETGCVAAKFAPVAMHPKRSGAERRMHRIMRDKSFTQETIDKLGYYVYRLVDPRTGITFYVGKGKGNRVFAHAAGAFKFSSKDGLEKGGEDRLSAKIKQIEDIHAASLEVITIIHRHGMDEETALEVEGALIDAYPGLTNVQNGHRNSDYGCVSTLQIQQRYAAEVVSIPSKKYLIIKVKESSIDEHGSLYEAARKSWHINVERAAGRMVLACVSGIIKGVFVVDKWLASPDCEGRMYFEGHEADTEISQQFVGKRLPQRFVNRGAASPIRYS